jgi:hypothetical protein
VKRLENQLEEQTLQIEIQRADNQLLLQQLDAKEAFIKECMELLEKMV